MPLRIIAISDRYLPVIGGAERQLNLLASELKRRGHRIQIVTRHVAAELPFSEVMNGIPIRRLRPTGLNKLANILIIPRIVLYLLKHRAEYDIIHSQSLGPISIAAVIAGKLLGKPVSLRVATAGDISRQETGKSPGLYSRFIRKYIVTPGIWRKILQNASVVISLSQEITQEAELRHINHHIKFIPNGVDCDSFHPIENRDLLREDLNLPIGVPIILSVGRLVARKRIDLVIDAMPDILKAYPHSQLIIVGTGKGQSDSVEHELRQQMQQLNLSDNVQFIGASHRIKDYLQIADLFVFSSEKEGMPNVVLEALASGIPMIASRIGGVVDLVDDSCAHLFASGDLNAMQEAILHVLNNPQDAQAKADIGRQRVKEQFSIQAIADKYEILFNNLLN